MGRHKRCKLPECVLTAVRHAHPNAAGVAHMGFVHTRMEWEEPEDLDDTPSDYEGGLNSEYVTSDGSSLDSTGTDD